MSFVRLTSWRPGLNKVALTRLLQSECGLSLADAKAATDRLLDGRAVTVEAADEAAANELIRSFDALGAVAHADQTPAARHVG